MNIALQKERKPGCKRTTNEMLHLHEVLLSAPTAQKVLHRNDLGELENRVRKRKYLKCYNFPVRPGVVRKIAPKPYHYAAIDDCSRYTIVGPIPPTANTSHFPERIVEEMPFPDYDVENAPIRPLKKSR